MDIYITTMESYLVVVLFACILLAGLALRYGKDILSFIYGNASQSVSDNEIHGGVNPFARGNKAARPIFGPSGQWALSKIDQGSQSTISTATEHKSQYIASTSSINPEAGVVNKEFMGLKHTNPEHVNPNLTETSAEFAGLNHDISLTENKSRALVIYSWKLADSFDISNEYPPNTSLYAFRDTLGKIIDKIGSIEMNAVISKNLKTSLDNFITFIRKHPIDPRDQVPLLKVTYKLMDFIRDDQTVVIELSRVMGEFSEILHEFAIEYDSNIPRQIIHMPSSSSSSSSSSLNQQLDAAQQHNIERKKIIEANATASAARLQALDAQQRQQLDRELQELNLQQQIMQREQAAREQAQREKERLEQAAREQAQREKERLEQAARKQAQREKEQREKLESEAQLRQQFYQKIQEQQAAEQKAAQQQQAAEQKAAQQQQAAEQKAVQQQAAEQKATEQKAAQQHAAEQKSIQHAMIIEKARQEALAGQRNAQREQELLQFKQQQAAEQKRLMEQQAAERVEREKKLALEAQYRQRLMEQTAIAAERAAERAVVKRATEQQTVQQYPRVQRQQKSDWASTNDIIPIMDPRDPVSVAQYLSRYHITATANEFARLMSAFPGTHLLNPADLKSLDSHVHIKHHLGNVLAGSRLLSERFSPLGQWQRDDARREFFFKQLKENSGYYIKNADFWRATDQFLRYVHVAPPEMLVNIINKIDPRRILDVNVMFGSAITALAQAKPQSAMYDGLCTPGLRQSLETLVRNASSRPTFPARINLIPTGLARYTPARGVYDMVISEIRTRNSEIIAGEAPVSDSLDLSNYLSERIAPMIAKITAAMTSLGTVVFLLTSTNPDLYELTKHIKTKFSIKDTMVSSQYTVLVCNLTAK